MDSREIRAVGDLLARGYGGFTTRIEELHAAIAARSFAGSGPGGRPAAAIHHRIARAAYGGVRGAGAALTRVAAGAAASLAPTPARPLADSPGGSLAIGAVSGMLGDDLERRASALTPSMTLRLDGAEVGTSPADLMAAYPRAGGRIAVFLHGLCETEHAWELFSRRHYGRPGVTYGSRLQQELGYTPLFVRYNTGLHISDNGRRLAGLLEEVVAAWPVEVSEIMLVGHSMGGLVIRSACHHAQASGGDWIGAVRHVFFLGSPHLGAPLEQAANVAGWALGRMPETRPLARVINVRSSGIKDLRFGALLEDDWCDCDPDALLENRCCDVPLLETANHYCMSATVTRGADGMVARVVGDLLVLPASARGQGRRRRMSFPVDHARHFAGLNHFQLLNHPAVYEEIRRWLAPGSVDRGRPTASRLEGR